MGIGTEIKRICEESKFNGNILFADSGDVQFIGGFGFTDRELLIPFTNDVVFRIGSVTKQITAVAILQLIERGKLRFEDTIDQYIEGVPYQSPITIHHLLSNSSGIPNFDIHLDLTELLQDPCFLKRLIQEIIFPLPLNFTPGERFEYSSSGFVILSYLLEKISGLTYIEYIKKYLFDPLKMNHSGFHFIDVEVPNFTKLYDFAQGEIIEAQPYNMRIASGAGGLYSTIQDLYLWGRGLIECSVLSKPYKDLMFAVQTPINPTGGYGYGIISVHFDKDGTTHDNVYHPGNGPGVFAQNHIIDNRFQLIMISNINDGKTFRKTNDQIMEYIEANYL